MAIVPKIVPKNEMGFIMEVILGFLISSKFGLILNMAGTIMVAFSVGKNPEGAHSNDKKGRPVYIASVLRPKLFYFGLIIMGLGFLLQFIA